MDLMVDLNLSEEELEDLGAELRAWGQTSLDRLFAESGIDILLELIIIKQASRLLRITRRLPCPWDMSRTVVQWV